MQLIDLRLLLVDLLGGDDVVVPQAVEPLEIEHRSFQLRFAHLELRARLLERRTDPAIVDARQQIALLDLLTFAHRQLDQLAVDLRPDDDTALRAHRADCTDHVGNILAADGNRAHGRGRRRAGRGGCTREPPAEGNERQQANRGGGQQRSA